MSRKCSSCLSLGSPVAVNRGLSPSQRGEYMVSREALVRCGEKCVNKNHLRLTLRSGHSRQGMTTEGFFVVVVVVAIRSTLRSGHTRQGMTTEGFFVVVVVAIRSTLRSGHTRQGMTTEGFFCCSCSTIYTDERSY